jgi:hypothetical protein
LGKRKILGSALLWVKTAKGGKIGKPIGSRDKKKRGKGHQFLYASQARVMAIKTNCIKTKATAKTLSDSDGVLNQDKDITIAAIPSIKESNNSDTNRFPSLYFAPMPNMAISIPATVINAAAVVITAVIYSVGYSISCTLTTE